MVPAFPDRFDTIAAAVTSLSHTLQQTPPVEDLFTHTEIDVDFINSRVSEAELLFGNLSKYRATLQYNLNLRASWINKVPQETLGEIFRHACDPRSEKAMTPTKIGAVCNHWRQVVWSDPQLWTELKAGKRFWKSSYRVTLLDLFFKNIGELRCRVTFLDMPHEGYESSLGIPQEDVFNRLFVKYADKLKALEFHRLPKSWIPHITSVTEGGQSLPNLESFVYFDNGDKRNWGRRSTDPPPPPLALYNVSRLRKLEITLNDIPFIPQTLIFPWAQLTKLILCNVSSMAALHIVLRCRNLVTLQLQATRRSDEGDPFIVLSSEPTVFRNLQELNYGDSLALPWEEALLKCLQFPALERLAWLTDGRRNFCKKFLLRLPTSLTQLRIDCRKECISIQDLRRVFARLKSLQIVTLYLDVPMDLEVVRLFMVANRRRFLPSLRLVKFTMMRRDLDAQCFSDLLDIVRSRWVKQGEKFLFEFAFPVAEHDFPSQVSNFRRSFDRIMGKEV